ncbi:putative DNA-binding transcriptional regulator [Enterobacterales bacterium 8AC]|jgi:DNA-binding transcriptional ArsR family regulator|nr:putative DNA-binding transcriptional regulator [Enterobacterales bacterium 8AC]
MMTTNQDLQALLASADAASKLLKAMSNPHRLLILCMLVDSPGTGAGELAAITGLSPSATSQHLARMRDEGLIENARDGQRINYFIKNTAVQEIISTLKAIYCP